LPRKGGRPPRRLETVYDISGEYGRLRLSHPELRKHAVYRLIAQRLGYSQQQLDNGAEHIRQQLRYYDKHSATGCLDELIDSILSRGLRK
jgi:hypothetical protein